LRKLVVENAPETEESCDGGLLALKLRRELQNKRIYEMD